MAAPDWVTERLAQIESSEEPLMSVDPGTQAPQSLPGGLGWEARTISPQQPQVQPQVPAGPQSLPPQQLMSVPPQQEATYSEPLVSTDPSQFTAQVPEYPQLQPQPQPMGGLGMLTNAYVQGTRGYVPERIAKTGEQWVQRGFGPMPGDVPTALPNRPLPGVDDPTPEQMGKPIITKQGRPLTDAQGRPLYQRVVQSGNRRMVTTETYSDRYQRLFNENAAKRAPTAVAPSQYERARQATGEAEGEALLDQRLAIQSQEDQQAQAERDAYLVGRGLADRQLQIQRDEEERRAAVDRHVSDVVQTLKKQERLAAVNPVSQYWDSKSFGDRLRISFAIGLGAAGQALAGGQNAMLDLVKAEIDGEVAKHRAMVDTVGTEIAAKRSLLGDAMLKFRDPQSADNALRWLFTAQLENQLRRQAARERMTELRAQKSMMADQLAVEKAKYEEQLVGAERTAAYAWQPPRATGYAGGIAGLTRLAKDLALTPEQERQMKLEYVKGGPGAADEYMKSIAGQPSALGKNELAQARFDQEHKVQLPGGGIGYVKNKNDFEAGMSSLNNMTDSLRQLRGFATKGSAWNATDRANVKAISDMAMGEVRVMLGLGVMSESDKELAQGLTGEFVNDRFSMADKLVRLDMLVTLVERKRKQYEQRITLDPNANIPYQTKIRTRQAQ